MPGMAAVAGAGRYEGKVIRKERERMEEIRKQKRRGEGRGRKDC